MTTCYLLGKSRADQLMTALYALAGERPAHGNPPAVIRLATGASFGRAHGWSFTSDGASFGKNGHFAGHEPGYTVKVIVGPLSGRMTGPPRINPVRICQFAGCGQFQNRSQCGSSFAVFLPDKT